MSEEYVKNYYQGIYLTETVMGNPNGDFIDNSPRNFDGKVFTTDKCIKYNIRRYIKENVEDLENEKNIVFFYPRLVEGANYEDAKYQTRDDVMKNLFGDDFNKLLNESPDVRMFGGTFSFKSNSKQIYGPIQLSYGIDLNDAEIKRLQIGAPFSTSTGKQKTNGSEYVVDDAIISYDITINPNNYPELLQNEDLELFKKSLWFGTNLRKSTSKKTDSKFLMLIKFKNISDSNDKVSAISIGELKELITIENKKNRDMGIGKIELNMDKLLSKLNKYDEYIENIDIYFDEDEVSINLKETDKIKKFTPNDLI